MLTAFRVFAGTAVYALIVVLAAPFPSAAGMMLVFPTLNGLAYVFSERSRVLAMAPSMLLMPIVNGALCTGCLLAFLALARSFAPTPLAFVLIALAVVLFVLLVWHPRVRRGVAPAHQLGYAIAATVIGVAAVALAAQISGPHGARAATFAWTSAGDVLLRNAGKIAVFAACLTAFLIVTRLLPFSDGVHGILAGLPFAPFAGLVTVAGDTGVDLATRLETVRLMATSIWLGPAIAIWFIYGFPRVLVRLPPQSALAVPVLMVAWGLCGLAVALATALLR